MSDYLRFAWPFLLCVIVTVVLTHALTSSWLVQSGLEVVVVVAEIPFMCWRANRWTFRR